MKRVVAVSDLHCGHVVGLTPPEYNPKFRTGPSQKCSDARAAYWEFFAETIELLQPIDVLIVNGDAIDGKGEASGGAEQITTDRNEQVAMAVAAIQATRARQIFMSYGTPYHTGKGEDWENQVADKAGSTKIGSHDWLDVNGLVFDYKHHIGGSQVPHTRHTPIARERLWNLLWTEWEEYPKADVFLRAHVHYFNYCGGHGWLGITMPALQGYGSKFGARRMCGTVDFGLLSFDVESKGEFNWQAHVFKPRTLRQYAFRVK